MKFFFSFLLVFLFLTSHSQVRDSIPKPIGYVSDFERILTPEQIDTLENIIADLEKRSSIEIAMVTVDSLMTDKQHFSNYVISMMNQWGVGKKVKNNGIMIGFSKKLRTIRIQVGEGLVKILSEDVLTGIIQQDFIPHFKEGNYYQGALNGLQALIKKVE